MMRKQKRTRVGGDGEKLEPCALLVGMKTGAAPVGCMVPQKLKIE